MIDAVPKKRGPKADVLEALVKRVDGLEKQLQDGGSSTSTDKNPVSPTSPAQNHVEDSFLPDAPSSRRHTVDSSFTQIQPQSQVHQALPHQTSAYQTRPNPDQPQQQPSPPQNAILPDAMLDAYFARLHGKPFFVLDENSTRQRHQSAQLPVYLSMAIHALIVRLVPFFAWMSANRTGIPAPQAPRSRPPVWVWIMPSRRDASWILIIRRLRVFKRCFSSHRRFMP